MKRLPVPSPIHWSIADGNRASRSATTYRVTNRLRQMHDAAAEQAAAGQPRWVRLCSQAR
jgi:hypothetical protein